MEKRIPALDGVRALAILMVAYFHFWQQNWLTPPSADFALFRFDLYPVAAGGFVGVELLFVLSGFLLFLPVAQGERLSLTTFYWKRFARIYPCYALCVLVTGIFAWGEFGGFLDWFSYLFQNLLFLNMFRPELLFSRFNSVLWSMSVEVWFYLLFPAFALAMRRAPRVTVTAAFVFSTLYRFWALRLSGDLPVYMNQLPGMLDCFIAGMFAGHLAGTWRGSRGEGHPAFSAVACTGAVFFLFTLYQMYLGRGTALGIQHYQVIYRPLFILSGCLLILGAALAPPLFQAVVGNRLFRFISAISFNLYLWHQWLSVKLRLWQFPPYAAADPHDDPVWQWQHMLLSFAVSVVAAALATYFVEKPASRLLLRPARHRQEQRQVL